MKVKICGIRSVKDAKIVLKARVDFIGLNFVPSSKRYVSIDQAQKIVQYARNIRSSTRIVGVFKDESSEHINTVHKLIGFDLAQLHGSESPEYCANIKAPIIKVFNLKSVFDVNIVLKEMKRYNVEYFLLDRKVQGEGEMLDPIETRLICKNYNVFIAGGLMPENVGKIAERVRPFCVDVAEGVETNSEIDCGKVRKFIMSVAVPHKYKNMFFSYKTKFDADKSGHFGMYGGRYAPEMLIPALEELEKFYLEAKKDPKFEKEYFYYLKTYVGRPSPLYFAENLTNHLGGAKIYMKNEGLNHTGAHKINHCVGQALLARRMGKKRLIAETGAGQHGVAAATVAARFGFKCTVYMGEEDMKRQRPNVFWMQRLGAEVIPVMEGSRTLKDAVNAALKDWITNVRDSHYILGSTLGPHPYPSMNRDFQQIIGYEVKQQMQELEGRQPDMLVACVSGGSNALGLFYRFLEDAKVCLVGVEAGGEGVTKKGRHASRFAGGTLGVVQGYKTVFLQDKQGNIAPTHSISAGLDYPGIGPQFAYLKDKGRVEFSSATDKEALSAFNITVKQEGILPALESSHAIAEVIKRAPKMNKNEIIVVNISGRADKDIFIVAEALKDNEWKEFINSKFKK